MLARWESPSAVCLCGIADDTEEDIPEWKPEPESWTPVIGKELNPTQEKQALELLEKHRKAFSNKPGRTSATEISIHTGDASPLSSPPYRLPHAKLEAVKEEVAELQREGLIVPSKSP